VWQDDLAIFLFDGFRVGVRVGDVDVRFDDRRVLGRAGSLREVIGLRNVVGLCWRAGGDFRSDCRHRDDLDRVENDPARADLVDPGRAVRAGAPPG
jgi:hypothetical protein